MPRTKKAERGTRGEPWYRKFNDTWYVDFNDKQTAIKDEGGGNVKGAGNRESAKRCWVLMQARMLAPEKGADNPVRMVFGLFLDYIQKDRTDAYTAYKRTLVGFSDTLPERDFLVRDITAFHVDRWLEEHPDWSSNTRATYIAHIMAAFNWAAEPHRRLIPANPLAGFKKPRRRSRGAEALVSANGQTRGAVLRGVPRDDLLSREIVAKNVVQGDLVEFSRKPGVVIGEQLRRAMRLRVGDMLTVVTHRLNDSGIIAPRYTDYEVLASFSSRRYEFDNTLIFVPLQALQEELEYGPETVSSIDLELMDAAAAPALAARLAKSLERDDLRIADWLSLNSRFAGALQVERVMMFIILTLIVLVAAMNVVASFTMLVRVKRGSIAILRTMGAGPGTIMRAFFMSAAAVGLVGTTIGTALGLLVCASMPTIIGTLTRMTNAGGSGANWGEIEFIASMPVRVQATEVVAVAIVAVVLSLAAAAYPAWRSTRVEPVEGLRYE